LVRTVGGLKGRVPIEEPVVPDREAALLLERAVSHVPRLHPHLPCPTPQVPAWVHCGLERHGVLPPESLNHLKDLAVELQIGLVLSSEVDEVVGDSFGFDSESFPDELPPSSLRFDHDTRVGVDVGHHEAGVVPVCVGGDLGQFKSSTSMSDVVARLVNRLEGCVSGEEKIVPGEPGAFPLEVGRHGVHAASFLYPDLSIPVSNPSSRSCHRLERDRSLAPETRTHQFKELGLGHEVALDALVHGPVESGPVLAADSHDGPR